MTAERDAAREAGVKNAFALGTCMESLQGARVSLANMTASHKKLELKLRDSDQPPCSSEDLEQLLKTLARIRTENEALHMVHERDVAEIGRLGQKLTTAPSPAPAAPGRRNGTQKPPADLS